MNMITKTYNRRVVGILGLVLITGIAGSIYYFRSSKQITVNESVKPISFIPMPSPDTDLTSWKTYSDPSLGFAIRYPPAVTVDQRQTSEGRLIVFISNQDKNKELPGKVPLLFIAGNQGKGNDGFEVFSQSDCAQPCAVASDQVQWVQLQNAYGIKNPLPNDVHNYYLTDKEKSGPVLNVYIGGNYDASEKTTQEKIDVFDRMIRTITLDR